MNSLIKVDVTQAVTADSQADQWIAEVLTVSERVQSVNNRQELALAVHAMNQLKKHPICGYNVVDADRKKIKRILDKRVDDLAAPYLSQLLREIERIQPLMNAFVIKEKERTEDLERQRQAEIAAIEAAHREADKATQLALSHLTSPDASLSEAEQEVLAREEADNLKVELDKALRSKPVTLDKPVGLVVKNVLRFEVTDPAALYAVRPDFFDLVAKRRVISDNITPSTTLPGLRVWQETVTETR